MLINIETHRVSIVDYGRARYIPNLTPYTSLSSLFRFFERYGWEYVESAIVQQFTKDVDALWRLASRIEQAPETFFATLIDQWTITSHAQSGTMKCGCSREEKHD